MNQKPKSHQKATPRLRHYAKDLPILISDKKQPKTTKQIAPTHQNNTQKNRKHTKVRTRARMWNNGRIARVSVQQRVLFCQYHPTRLQKQKNEENNHETKGKKKTQNHHRTTSHKFNQRSWALTGSGENLALLAFVAGLASKNHGKTPRVHSLVVWF